MILTTLFALAPLALSAPLTLRAGGPGIVSIPSTCSVTCAAPTYPTDAFKATDSFTSTNSVFNQYIPSDSVTNVSASYNTCLEQCFGFGNPGECVSTVFASNVTYQAYGVTSVGYACIMFGKSLTGADMEAVTDGSWAGARGTNIGCARSE
ncbi:hypothetical protein MMC10_002955 [Thelotrema lepadinum]|nr:hypothetical protein [Thelotrema lepadinum]